jgi:hypothetical protein
MNFFNAHLDRMSPVGRRRFLLAVACLAAIAATILLLQQAGSKEILYKAF